jgi:hypothetical protein
VSKKKTGARTQETIEVTNRTKETRVRNDSIMRAKIDDRKDTARKKPKERNLQSQTNDTTDRGVSSSAEPKAVGAAIWF